MAKKFQDWKTLIFVDGEKLYVREVLKPVLSRIRTARQKVKASMPKGKTAKATEVSAVKAELARIDQFEARVRQHMEETSRRFGARRAKAR